MAITAQMSAVPRLQREAAIPSPSKMVKAAEEVAATVTTTKHDQNILRSRVSCFFQNYFAAWYIFYKRKYSRLKGGVNSILHFLILIFSCYESISYEVVIFLIEALAGIFYLQV